MNIEDVCSPKSPMHFTCPGANTFFTASVLWGTIGPVKVFGINGQYKWLLLGFPSGVLIVLGLWGLRKAWPSSRALRQVHAVALISGALHWAPYSTTFPLPCFLSLSRSLLTTSRQVFRMLSLPCPSPGSPGSTSAAATSPSGPRSAHMSPLPWHSAVAPMACPR